MNVATNSVFPSYDGVPGSGTGVSDATMEEKYGTGRTPRPAVFRPLISATDSDSLWPAEISREEIAAAHKTQTELRRLDAAIQRETDRVTFLRNCRLSVSGEALIMVDSPYFDRLMFGAFSISERVARIDGEIAEAHKARAEFDTLRARARRELEEQSRKIQAAVDAGEFERRTDQAMLAAEQANQMLDAIACAIGELPVRVRRGYSFFSGAFQRERGGRER